MRRLLLLVFGLLLFALSGAAGVADATRDSKPLLTTTPTDTPTPPPGTGGPTATVTPTDTPQTDPPTPTTPVETPTATATVETPTATATPTYSPPACGLAWRAVTHPDVGSLTSV